MDGKRQGMACLLTLCHQLQDSHVLYEDGIHTCVGQFVEQTTDILQFIIIDDGVQRDKHPRPEAVGILTQLTDILQTVTS